MKAIIVFLIATLCATTLAQAAPAANAYEQGLRVAKRRGVAEDHRACFAKAFANYARQNRNGVYTAPGRRLRMVFETDLHSTCGL